MKKTSVIFILLTLSFNSWAQSYTRTDFEQKADQKLVRTTQVDVQEEQIVVNQSLLNEETGDLVWDESKKWPITYKKAGHVVGEHDKKRDTTMSLIYTDELLQQFTSEFEVDEYLRKAYEQAKDEGKTQCPDGFTNYKALALETSKDFSKVFQAICFK